MGEIFGIYRATGLSPDDITEFSYLRKYIEKHSGVTAQVYEDSYSRIGLLLRHKIDTGFLHTHTKSGTWLVSLGTVPTDIEIDRLYNQLENSEFSSPQLLCPPFVWIIGRPHASVWILSDPFGLQPVNIHRNENGSTIFSSRLLPLAATTNISLKVDPNTITNLLNYEHPMGNETILRDVSIVQPGAMYELGTGNVKIWSSPLKTVPTKALPLKEISKQFHSTLCDAVEKASGNNHVAITLSGGLDSRTLLGCALERGIRPLTVTFETPDSNDSKLANTMAAKANLRHIEIPFDHNFLVHWLEHIASTTDGTFSAIHARICMLSEILSSEADVVLDGLAGDAFTGGHLTPYMLATRKQMNGILAVGKMRMTSQLSNSGLKNLLQNELLADYSIKTDNCIRAHFENLKPKDSWWGCHRFDFLERQRRFIQFGPHLLRDQINVATPFYDPNVTSCLLSMPRSALLEQRGYLHMQRNWLKEMSEIPDATRNVPVNWPFAARFAKRVYDVGRRKFVSKIGTPDKIKSNTPAAWFRGPLRTLVEQTLLDDLSLEDIVQRKTLENILSAHNSGKEDYSTLIGTLLSLSTFYRLAHAARLEP